MTRSRRLLLLGVLVAVTALVAGTLAVAALAQSKSDAPSTQVPGQAAVQYSVPFICGWLPPVPPDLEQHAKPGDYATAINIHNPTTTRIVIEKQVALHYRMGSPAPPAIPSVKARIDKVRVLQIDCVDIWAMAGLPPGSFVKGAVHLGMPVELQVAAIYTSQTHDDPNAGPGPAAGHSIDVEIITPFSVAPVG